MSGPHWHLRLIINGEDFSNDAPNAEAANWQMAGAVFALDKEGWFAERIKDGAIHMSNADGSRAVVAVRPCMEEHKDIHP